MENIRMFSIPKDIEEVRNVMVMKGNQRFRPASWVSLVVLCSMLWTLCLADRNGDPCQYFANNTKIRDPDDCSVGITCVDFKSTYTTICTGTKPFYDKDKAACAASLTDHSLCDISCANSTGKFVADPKSCYGYYYCQDEDWARYGHCPEDTHFEFETQMCMHSSSSNCTAQELNFCAIVKDGVNFNDPSSCEKYFTCKKGSLTSVSCKNTYYDAISGTCIQKSLIDCVAHPYPSDVCGTVKKPKANVFVSDGATCRGAFYCAAVEGGVDKAPAWVQCPENLFFSESQGMCLSPQQVACSADRCEGRNKTFVSSGTAGCRHYLRCADNIQVEELTCGNKFFDEDAGVCTTTIVKYPSCS